MMRGKVSYADTATRTVSIGLPVEKLWEACAIAGTRQRRVFPH
jgi:hypothetical protein